MIIIIRYGDKYPLKLATTKELFVAGLQTVLCTGAVSERVTMYA